jgi:catechol 2,3-dioxygenase-like lactoylglutathione lyase family enzyme
MVQRFDHVTFVVNDVPRAKSFFSLLGFVEDKTVVISGPKFAAYMAVPGIEAEHVTLVLADASPRTEIQLLNYRHPATDRHVEPGDPTRHGFNHICFAVKNMEAEIERLQKHGVALLNTMMDFHSRKLVFLKGPEGIVVELAEWNGDG